MFYQYTEVQKKLDYLEQEQLHIRQKNTFYTKLENVFKVPHTA